VVIQNISASFSELFPNYVPPSPLPRKVGGHDLPPAPMGAPPLVAHLHHRLYIDAGKQLQGLAQTDRLRTATVFTQRSAVAERFRDDRVFENVKLLDSDRRQTAGDVSIRRCSYQWSAAIVRALCTVSRTHWIHVSLTVCSTLHCKTIVDSRRTLVRKGIAYWSPCFFYVRLQISRRRGHRSEYIGTAGPGSLASAILTPLLTLWRHPMTS